MRKSILIIAALVFGLLTANATTPNSTPTTFNNSDLIKDDIVKIYNWSVTTTVGQFSGTASTLTSAERRVQLASNGLIVLEHIITSYFVVGSDINKPENRLYFWEVQSENGRAKGFSTSEASAHRMINLVSSGDVVYYKIVASSEIK
ncbi:hypothetical protein ES677_10015 [Bizionia gelidisalsuginis]|uniref:Uncharacterized protein n=2 Tax=Bizionia TaxID=283785 RepID=A0A8H2QFL7_9FLAO|nr:MULTISPECIES: hypothetical protein [Bizionia]TYB76106.1 hypothetical protein ES676_06540 [Bizionia saleffrena]TYC11398.1 hypothetical protein ES677_10015 [Bizionia gelidisalsuginis]